MLYRQMSAIPRRRKHDAHCETMQEDAFCPIPTLVQGTASWESLMRVPNLDSFSKASPLSFHD